MKPPNTKIIIIAKLPAAIEGTTVRKIEAIKRNMDIDVRCTAKNRTNWRKNLKAPNLLTSPVIAKDIMQIARTSFSVKTHLCTSGL